MHKIILTLALLTPISAIADEWIAVPGFKHRFEIDLSSRQSAQRPGSKAQVEAIWVRATNVSPWQVRIDCESRLSQSFNEPPLMEAWGNWKPISPETYEWEVWEYICQPKSEKAPKPKAPKP
jgi:hypothetical protein